MIVLGLLKIDDSVPEEMFEAPLVKQDPSLSTVSGMECFMVQHSPSVHSPYRVDTYEDPASGSQCLFAGYLYEANSLCLAESILEDYYTKGPSTAFCHNGSYLIVLSDRTKGTVCIATDKWGVFPVFYAADATRVAFSTRPKDLLEQIDLTPNEQAIREYLAIGNTLKGKTLYQNLNRVDAGCFVRFNADGNGPESIPYFNYSTFEVETFNSPSARELAISIEIFAEVMSGLMQQLEGRPVCMTSAGLDSRRILFEMLRTNSNPFVYTVETPQKSFLTPTSIDRAVVERMLRDRDATFQAFAFPSLAELPARYERLEMEFFGLLDEHEWAYALVDGIPNDRGVNFDGIAGDTFFTNPFYRWSDEIARLHYAPELQASCIANNSLDKYIRSKDSERTTQDICHELTSVLQRLPADLNRLSLFGMLSRTKNVVSLLPMVILSPTVDSVFPFLDDRLVKHSLSLDPCQKRKVRFQRLICDQMLPELNTLPDSHQAPAKIDVAYCQPMPNRWREDWGPENTYSAQAELAKALAYINLLGFGHLRSRVLSAKGRLVLGVAKILSLTGGGRKVMMRMVSRFWAVPRLVRAVLVLEKSKTYVQQTPE